MSFISSPNISFKVSLGSKSCFRLNSEFFEFKFKLGLLILGLLISILFISIEGLIFFIFELSFNPSIISFFDFIFKIFLSIPGITTVPEFKIILSSISPLNNSFKVNELYVSFAFKIPKFFSPIIFVFFPLIVAFIM